MQIPLCAVFVFAFLITAGPRSQQWVEKRFLTARTAAMAYDEVRGRVVLFGGGQGNTVSSETWEWSGTVWVERQPATVPAPRQYHSLAFDHVRGHVLMFGGVGVVPNETWTWQGADWVRLSTANAPQARYGHALASDDGRQRVVLFGGRPRSGPRLGDTWEWDGTDWTAIPTAVAPTGREGHAMAYDPVRQRTVLFGGTDGSVNWRDTWEWDGTQWLERSPATTPDANGYRMAYDATRQRVVLRLAAMLDGGLVRGRPGAAWIGGSEGCAASYRRGLRRLERNRDVEPRAVAWRDEAARALGVTVE